MVYVDTTPETDRVYTMSDASPVILSTSEPAVVARLDNGRANVIDDAAVGALTNAVDVAEEAELPLVVLGRDGIFSAGFDLKVFEQGPEATAALVLAGARLLLRLVEARIPVVIGATGHSVAMGALLLLAADYRMGADGRFKIGLNEVAAGMVLPSFATTLAEDRLSKRHILRATTMAEMYQPADARDAGYLDEVVAPDELEEATLGRAEALAGFSSAVYGATKAKVRGGLATRLQAAIEADQAAFDRGSS